MNAIANYQRWDVSFDEAFYLQTNPDVAAAVAAGVIPSGGVHFVNFGVKEGRIGKPGQLYDEATYLAENPDVAAAVSAGAFASGFEHFVLFGRQESRNFSPYFDEKWYRKRYPDVDKAIQAGAFASAFDHYLSFGRSIEKRNPSSLNELRYLRDNPDVAAAVENELLLSGQHHYFSIPRAFARPATLAGTPDNDHIIAGNNGDILTGVAIGVAVGEVPGSSTGFRPIYDSAGFNEMDTLTGGAGWDTFVLGSVAPTGGVAPNVTLPGNGLPGSGGPAALYLETSGQGYAEIRNFDPIKDTILISPDLRDFKLEARGSDTALISTILDFGRGVRAIPDLFAIVKDSTPEQVRRGVRESFLPVFR